MSKKEKILAQLSDQRKGLKKMNLSMVGDLQSAIERMKSYDLEDSYSVAFTDYEYAVDLMESLKNAVRDYLSSEKKFTTESYDHSQAYQEAANLYGEITTQLDSLGVEESPEIRQYGDDLAEGEAKGQAAFEKTQSEFKDHNKLVDISDFN